MRDPVVLQLPADLLSRVLDLENATLPWSSSHFAGLGELHLDFAECDAFVEISEEGLLGIFEASPQLESLLLLRLRPKIPIVGDHLQYTPTRIVKFASLTCLNLDSFPDLVGYILARMSVPAIDSLVIRAEFFSPWEVGPYIGCFSPDDQLANQLLPNPPIFEVLPGCGYGIYDSLSVKIGGNYIQFNFDMDESQETSDAIMASILPLVPPSVTSLRLDYSNLDRDEWSEFFQSHVEVRSIESSSSKQGPMSESLWHALSPAGADAVTLRPKLESISLYKESVSTSLLDCLRNRKIAGYGLKHLKLYEVDDGFAEKLRPWVEEVRVIVARNESVRRVRPILRDGMDHVLTTSQWGNHLRREAKQMELGVV